MAFGYAELMMEKVKLEQRLTAAEAENARLREALEEVVNWADDLKLYSEPGTHLSPVFVKAKNALKETEAGD